MAVASGKSFGKFFTSYTKGVLVELPLATAEGFRAMPRLWGEEVKDYGKVTDWKSGATVAGKNAVLGLGQGFRNIVEHPTKGAQNGGFLGAAKGVATGAGSLLSKTASAGLGLVAYPGQGITKSLHTLMHGGTARTIAARRRTEGEWLAMSVSPADRRAVVDRYHELQRSDKS